MEMGWFAHVVIKELLQASITFRPVKSVDSIFNFERIK
jgi:hypothetical protein